VDVGVGVAGRLRAFQLSARADYWEGSNMSVRKTRQVGTPAAKEVTEVDAVEETQPTSIFERFKQSIQVQDEEEPEPYGLIVPERRDVTMLYRTHDLDFDTYQAWTRKCEDKKNKEVNFFLLSIIVLTNLNVGIKLEDELVTRDGEDMTITNPHLHEFLGVPIGSTRQAIRKMYKNDGHMIQAMKMVVEKCGYSIEGDVQEAGDNPLDI
jgi:hypothetical protein